MPAARDDYLIRLITQAAAAIRRLREKLTGGGQAEEVVRDAGAAIGELLGSQRTMLEMLDARSAAALAGDTERVAHWGALIRIQADAERMLGKADAAERLEKRADALDDHVRQAR